jgi:hypothetical protein
MVAAAAGCGSSGPAGDACPKPAAPVSGAVKAGELCSLASDCAFAPGEIALCDAANQIDFQQKLQRCHVLVHGHSGDTCSASRTAGGALLAPGVDDIANNQFPATSALCEGRDHLACDKMTHTCRALAAIGESCVDILCTRDAHCNAGTCAAPLPIGHHCESTDDFLDQPWCDGSGFCDVVMSTCTSRQAIGAQCYLDRACTSNNCQGGICVAAETCL